MSKYSFQKRLTSVVTTSVLLTAALSRVSNATTRTRIVPVQTTAIFSSGSANAKWSIPIKSSDGHTVYTLSFDHPFLWVGGQLEGMDLVLQRPHDKADAPNLLEPPGNWHGLQAYMFAADDLAKGGQHLAFGEKRTITVNKLGLIVRIVVLNAKVSPISSEDFQLDSLNLKIEVDNLTP